MPLNPLWQPTTFLRFEEALDTSMGTARIVTDAGPAYIKALGNRQGPHPLVCEWVAAQLADWFGLPTFDFALLTIDAAVDEIPLFRGRTAASGTAFVSRATPGHPWGGSTEELRELVNPATISRLVVFDTWVRNCDRYPPDLITRKPNFDNVFLADNTTVASATRPMLVAMDHSHCFSCGRDLDETIAKIDWVKDDRLYGLFPGFVPMMQAAEVKSAAARLHELSKPHVIEVVESIPKDWDVPPAGRQALVELVCRRAPFVAETAPKLIASICWPE